MVGPESRDGEESVTVAVPGLNDGGGDDGTVDNGGVESSDGQISRMVVSGSNGLREGGEDDSRRSVRIDKEGDGVWNR